MKIELHIERLVLDGFAPGSIDGERVRNALGAELTRLLQATPPPTQARALPSLRAAALPAIASMHASALGAAVAQSLHGVIGTPSGGRGGRG